MSDSEIDLDPHSDEYRKKLSKMLIRLFDHWEITLDDQEALLGLGPNSRDLLMAYRRGEPLMDNLDLLDRAGNLLSIHRSLRMIFPNNIELVYGWVSKPNKRFENKPPLEFMREHRFEGLVMIRRYLNFESER